MRYGKGLKATIITAIILSVAFCFFACTERPDIKGANVLPSDPVGEVVYTVTFDSVGGSGVASVSASVNEKISEPAKPVRNGYAFDGWYTSENYFTKWDFGKDIVTSNVTLYARWRLQNDVFIDSAAFSFSPSGCVYSVSAATERVSLTDDIVLKQPNYRYAFFRDEECT
ncbi:MAG: InlB B-repeat-containing protein, partial [Christensenellales bacterium]